MIPPLTKSLKQYVIPEQCAYITVH